MAKAPTSYAGNLARAIGQGVTFGFGDEIEAGIRSLGSDRSYDEEVADIRKSISEFRETNPVAAYGSEIVGSIPTGIGLAGLALRGGLKGAAKIGALEGSIYGAGEGEGVEGTATSTALGAGLGAAGGKVAEKAFEGIAPLVGKFMKKTRGSGIEVKGSGNIEMEASPSDLGPMVKEAGSDEFVPLEKKVGAPGTPGEVKPVLNPAVKKGLSRDDIDYDFVHDYSPLESVLANSKQVLGEGKKGFTGEQLLPRLKKAGVTDAEIEVSGIGAFAASNKTVKRPASDYLDYVKENAPEVDYMVKYKSRGEDFEFEDMDNFEGFLHEKAQRLTTPNAASEVDYGELIVYNRKAPEASTRTLTHHPDVRGSFAHMRFSDHNDASGGLSRFVEENQFDVVQQQYGKDPISNKLKKNFVDLTPAKIDQIEGRISQLSDSPDYKALQGFRQEKLDLDAKVASLKQKEQKFDAEFYRRKDKFNKGINDAGESFLSIGKSMRQPGASRVMIDAEFSVAAPNFLKGVLQDVLDKNAMKTNGMLNADQLKEALRKGIDFPSRSRAFGPPELDVEDMDKVDFAALKISKAIEDFAIENIDRGMKRAAASAYFNTRPAARRPTSNVLNASEDSTMFVRNLLSEVPDSRQIDFKSIVKEQEAFNIKKQEAVQDRLDITDLQIQADKVTSRVNEKRDKIFRPESDELVEYMYKNQYVGKPIRDTDVEFVPNQPFRNQKQAARHNVAMIIKDARARGINKIYFPDYRDVAKLRGVDAKAFKITYDDVPKKYIEELKKEFPDLKTGKLTPDEFVENHIGDSNVDHPVTYLDLDFSKSDESIIGRDNLLPRRYKRGGKVDMRSGIGDLFRIYS